MGTLTTTLRTLEFYRSRNRFETKRKINPSKGYWFLVTCNPWHWIGLYDSLEWPSTFNLLLLLFSAMIPLLCSYTIWIGLMSLWVEFKVSVILINRNGVIVWKLTTKLNLNILKIKHNLLKNFTACFSQNITITLIPLIFERLIFAHLTHFFSSRRNNFCALGKLKINCTKRYRNWISFASKK